MICPVYKPAGLDMSTCACTGSAYPRWSADTYKPHADTASYSRYSDDIHQPHTATLPYSSLCMQQLCGLQVVAEGRFAVAAVGSVL